MSALERAARSWLDAAPSVEGPEWAVQLRREAARRVRERGFPTMDDEAWRLVPLPLVMDTGFEPGPAEAMTITASGGEGGAIIEMLADVLASAPEKLHGHLGIGHREVAFEPERRLGIPPPPGAERVLRGEGHHPFRDLSTALIHDGIVVTLRGTAATPVAVDVTTKAAGGPPWLQPRLLVVAEPGSRAVVVERYRGSGLYAVNAVTEVSVGAGAEIDHVRVQEDGDAAFHLASLCVRLHAGARYRFHMASLGARLGRVDVDVALAGEGAEALLLGLYVAAGEQYTDHHTFVDHLASRTRSRQRLKGLLDGASRGVFDGKVAVRRGSVGSSAHQENRNLILSGQALAHTKPSLLIDADDVSCGHGATVGQLDAEALFYLRSRGLPEASAKGLLTHAFAREVLDSVPGAELRREILDAVRSRLPGLELPAGDEAAA